MYMQYTDIEKAKYVCMDRMLVCMCGVPCSLPMHLKGNRRDHT